MSTTEKPSPIENGYVSADEYCRLARLRITGRTLQNYCRRNPYLAERIGEIRWPGKTQYDGRTAKEFRRHFAVAEKAFRNAQADVSHFVAGSDERPES